MLLFSSVYGILIGYICPQNIVLLLKNMHFILKNLFHYYYSQFFKDKSASAVINKLASAPTLIATLNAASKLGTKRNLCLSSWLFTWDVSNWTLIFADRIFNQAVNMWKGYFNFNKSLYVRLLGTGWDPRNLKKRLSRPPLWSHWRLNMSFKVCNVLLTSEALSVCRWPSS